MQWPEEDHSIRIGIDSCAAATVFPKSVADDYPMLHTPGKVKSHRPASGRLLPDLGVRKVQVKFEDGSLRHANPRINCRHAQSQDGGASQERQKYQGVCVPRV